MFLNYFCTDCRYAQYLGCTATSNILQETNRQCDQSLNKSYTYFLEKSSVLIWKLICGQGTAKQRLVECETEIMKTLLCPVPKELEPMQSTIRKNLSSKGSIYFSDKINLTAFCNTMIHMRNAKVSQIISDIYSHYDEVKFRQQNN